jgi:hypothetical protein
MWMKCAYDRRTVQVDSTVALMPGIGANSFAKLTHCLRWVLVGGRKERRNEPRIFTFLYTSSTGQADEGTSPLLAALVLYYMYTS